MGQQWLYSDNLTSSQSLDTHVVVLEYTHNMHIIRRWNGILARREKTKGSTDREDSIRIISARKASPGEVKAYEEKA
jgi:uncharacterized DUF497 family protein